MSVSGNSLQGHRGVFFAVLAFTGLSAGLAAMLWLQLNSDNDKVIKEARDEALSAVTETVHIIGRRVESLKVAEQLAAEMDSGALTIENLDKRIRHEISGDNDIAITVGWLPGYYPYTSGPLADTGIHFKLGFKLGDVVHLSDGEYTSDEVADREHGDISAWYRDAILEKHPVWFGTAYLSPVNNTWWAGGYSVPFFIDGQVAGVVAAELTVEQANKAMFKAEDAGFSDTPIDSNFGILVSKSGTMFSHPNLNVVEQRKSISNLVPRLSSPADIRSVYPESRADSETEIYVLDDIKRDRTGQSLTLFFAPINKTGWWVVLLLDQTAIDRDVKNVLRIKTDTIGLYMSLLALVFGLALLALRVDRGQEIRLWVAAFVFSSLCVAGIGGVLYYSLHQDNYSLQQDDDSLQQDNDSLQQDNDSLQQDDDSLQQDRQSRSREVRLQNLAITAKAIMRHQGENGLDPITVPTGIFIQSAKFSSANDVTVTGFVWQKYASDLPNWLQRDAVKPKPGFVFPEAEQMEVELNYQHETDNGRVYGWYFTGVLRQKFDYTKYPFDRVNVWVRIWHSEIGRGVILTPDLRSYDTLVPKDFPGIELQDFVLEGWDVTGTYFSYRHNKYITNLGLNKLERERTVPELYFNIAMTRAPLNAFIMNFITITVVAIMLFAVLLTIRRDKAKSDLLGFNVSAVLGFCAALFFVVILAHTSLRETLAAQKLVYLEYYFFVMYFTFLGVSINAIVAASDIDHRIIRHGDNLVARLLYWPLLSFSLLVVTLKIF